MILELFLAYIKKNDIQLTRNQLDAAYSLLTNHDKRFERFLLRGESAGKTFLFETLENFSKDVREVTGPVE